jgi:hypothetical protein
MQEGETVPKEDHKGGVYISDREMYEILLTTKQDVSTIRHRIERFETVDERSRQGLKLAEEAKKEADDAMKEAKEANDRIDRLNQYVLFAFIGGTISLLFYMVRSGLVQ